MKTTNATQKKGAIKMATKELGQVNKNGTRYFTCAETAKLVREALKASFAGTKFSVRSKTYAGGSSISVDWTDGPMQADVAEVTVRFEGADFDAMTDCKTTKNGILMDADGNVEQVHYGANFIFPNRHLSPEAEAIVKKATEEYWGIDDLDYNKWYEAQRCNGQGLCWRIGQKIDFRK